jgi:hypothetical protein
MLEKVGINAFERPDGLSEESLRCSRHLVEVLTNGCESKQRASLMRLV